MRLAYSTGFWCTNIGNAFFSMGVEYVLKKIVGADNVTVVSDLQTYANGYGKRQYPDKNQLQYLSKLDIDYLVLAGPVISKYFLSLWKDILIELEERGIGYILLSVGMMKMDKDALEECKCFFEEHPPFILCSRETNTFEIFKRYAKHAYDGICFSFFTPDYYHPCGMYNNQPFITCNFDKTLEPHISIVKEEERVNSNPNSTFEFEGNTFCIHASTFSKTTLKTDRFTDALIYIRSLFPQPKRLSKIGPYSVIRTDHRFYPHYRRKIYNQNNSFCADVPYGYINIYANTKLTLSDRVHACAVTLSYGNSAMLFAKTNRVGLLNRVGLAEFNTHPVKLDLELLNEEKIKMVSWLTELLCTNK